MDTTAPCRPTLEVEALVRPGDVDQGPLLVTVADYLRMVGMDEGPPCLRQLDAKGRIVEHLGVQHLSFPTWTPIDV